METCYENTFHSNMFIFHIDALQQKNLLEMAVPKIQVLHRWWTMGASEKSEDKLHHRHRGCTARTAGDFQHGCGSITGGYQCLNLEIPITSPNTKGACDCKTETKPCT